MITRSLLSGWEEVRHSYSSSVLIDDWICQDFVLYKEPGLFTVSSVKKNQASDLINNDIEVNFTAYYFKQTDEGKLKGGLDKHGRSHLRSS